MTASKSLTDLMAAVAQGDKDAFARLYALTSAKLFSLAIGILKRRDWAEDVLQDAYIRVWRSAQRFDPARGTPMSWMVTIVRNSAFTMLERRGREQPSSGIVEIEELASADPSPFEQAAQNAAARALLACMEELEDKQRQAIALAYYEGLTHAELAARLETPVGTIKSWIRRGLMRLKTCLERTGGGD